MPPVLCEPLEFWPALELPEPEFPPDEPPPPEPPEVDWAMPLMGRAIKTLAIMAIRGRENPGVI